MSHTPRTPAQVPKSMSSRLLTMKFMQRAAASSTTSLQTPPVDPETPPAKRQKIATPSSAPASLSDLQAVRDALQVEEDRNAEARDRVAAIAGETKWVLSCADYGVAQEKGARYLNVIATGYSEIDREDVDSGPQRGQEGRRRFGKFNYEVEMGQSGPGDDMLGSGEDEIESPDSEDSAAANELMRDARQLAIQDTRSNHNADSRKNDVEAARFREIRKKGDVNLKKLFSISSRRERSDRSSAGMHGNAAQNKSAGQQSTGKRKYDME